MKLKMISLCCNILIIFWFVSFLFADRGMIPVRPGVSVYEPGQKAIIAWNGKMEILILSTDVYAEKDTKVLEILPLPSKPSVKKGAFKSFEYIDELIRAHSPPVPHYRGETKALSGKEKGVKILFYKKIGAHSITCVEASDWEEFTKFSKDFVKKEGIKSIAFPEGFSQTIEKYVKNRFNYFIFDLIEIGSEKNSVEPVIYTFKTKYLYFPLEISSVIEGETDITLFLFTKEKLNLRDTGTGMRPGSYYLYGFHPFPKETKRMMSELEEESRNRNIIQFKVSAREQVRIHPDIDRLFWGSVYISTLWYAGDTKGLRNDLLMK